MLEVVEMDTEELNRDEVDARQLSLPLKWRVHDLLLLLPISDIDRPRAGPHDDDGRGGMERPSANPNAKDATGSRSDKEG